MDERLAEAYRIYAEHYFRLHKECRRDKLGLLRDGRQNGGSSVERGRGAGKTLKRTIPSQS